MPHETRKGLGVTLSGFFPDCPPMTARVPVTTEHKLIGFKFQDTIATYVSDEFDPLHPDGYGKVDVDKYGTVHKRCSYIAGLIGGATEVSVFPAQFGLPCEPGTEYVFHVTPSDLLSGCVQAVRETVYPPEYVI